MVERAADGGREGGDVMARKEPDCVTCWKKDSCERAREGAFCPQWQSAEPAPEGPDPNGQWRKGEDSDG